MADFLDLRYFQDIAVGLEAARFHMAFIDDRLAMPSVYGDSFQEAVEHGVRVVKLDLVPVITAMGLATSHLGLGATYSTTYYSPFHVARLFASLGPLHPRPRCLERGHFLERRGGPELRRGRAPGARRPFMTPPTSSWRRRWPCGDSWEDGAVLADKESGKFADPGKVRRADYSGEFFQARGPLTVPRPPQGHPVIIQAGQSERGRRFAARWGELLFVIFPTAGQCRAYREDLRERAAAAGRGPDAVKVAPAVYVVVAETEQAAREKREFIESLARPVDSLALLSEVFNYDFSRHPPDEPLSDETLASMTGLRGFLGRVIELSGSPNPSVNDFVRWSGRGTLRELPVFCGSPRQVADEMEHWYSSGSCDGFCAGGHPHAGRLRRL